MAAVVPKQAVGVAVLVRDEQIQIAVAVDVEPHGADGLARIADARLDGDVGEAAVVVAKQPVRLIAECHEEIEIAIVVVVDPRRLPRHADETEAERRRHVGEMASVAVVSIQLVGDAAGKADVQIEVAIAVEVAPRRDACLDRVRQADGRRDILEPSVVLPYKRFGRPRKPTNSSRSPSLSKSAHALAWPPLAEKRSGWTSAKRR